MTHLESFNGIFYSQTSVVSIYSNCTHKKTFLIGFIGVLIFWLFTVQLISAASLKVQVVDVDDTPVTDLPMILSLIDSDIELHSNTNSQGECTFSSLENKVYALILQGFEHNYYKAEEDLEIFDEINHYKLVVREKASFRIQIFYDDGLPAENIRVILRSDSGAYKQLFESGQRTDYDGIIMYPYGVPEDNYTVIIMDKTGTEIARHTESISSDIVNHIIYNVEKPSTIPSYPLLSVVSGLVYWFINRRQTH